MDSGGPDTQDTQDTQAPGPADQDEDGHDETVDCDDLDPSVHPGAEETWNEVDDDCDGRIDGDGEYAGNHQVRAWAVYEAQEREFIMDCATTMARGGAVVSFTVQCQPDLAQPYADVLLGEIVTMEVKQSDAAITGSSWSGRTVVRSSNGWESWGEAQLSWSDMDHASLSSALDTYSLDMVGLGSLELE